MKTKKRQIAIPESIYSLTPTVKVRGLDAYQDNPFLSPNNFVIEVRQDLSIIASGLEIKDKEGDNVNAGLIGKIQYVDTEQFIKLYTKNVSMFFELSITAQKTLIAVLAAIQENSKDIAHVYIKYNNAVKYYEKMNMMSIPSNSVFSRGITQLIKAGFLARHYNGDGWYWFNPNLIFNGDRVRFVEEYRLKRKKEHLEESTQSAASALRLPAIQ